MENGCSPGLQEWTAVFTSVLYVGNSGFVIYADSINADLIYVDSIMCATEAAYTKADTDCLPHRSRFFYRFQIPYVRKIRQPADSVH